MGPSWTTPSCRGNTPAGAPRRADQDTQPSEGPTIPHPQGVEGHPHRRVRSPSHFVRSQWVRCHCRGACRWTGHFDSYCGGASWGARHPPMQQEVGERRKVPGSIYPGWTEVIHLTWLATPAGWTPLTLGELRQHHHSWSSGGRKAQHWQAEEHRMAVEGESDLMSSWGSPMANPGVAPPAGFRGVAACLLSDSPSLAPVESPLDTRLPDVIAGPTVTTLSATQIVQDEATRVTYVDTVTTSVERVALGNPAWQPIFKGPCQMTSPTSTK